MANRSTVVLGWGVLACAALSPAWAQVHRCVDAAGKVSFSDTACGPGAQQAQQVMGAQATAPTSAPTPAPATASAPALVPAVRAERPAEAVAAPTPASPAAAGTMDAGRTGNQAVRSNFAPKAEDQAQTESSRWGPVGGSRERNPNWSPSRGYYGGGGPADQRYEQEHLELERLRALQQRDGLTPESPRR